MRTAAPHVGRRWPLAFRRPVASDDTTAKYIDLSGENSPMAHDFLSDGWFEAVKGLRDKYADEAPKVPYAIRMNQVITAAPFTDDDIKIFMDTTDGTMVMDKGELANPELTLTTDWETARKIFVEQDQAAGMQAFMSGKIKVQGDMMKMMQMNAVPPDEFAKKIANEIKDLTA
jgi:putative sterol carrier protein